MKLKTVVPATVLPLAAVIAVWTLSLYIDQPAVSPPAEQPSSIERRLPDWEPLAHPPELVLDDEMPGSLVMDEAAKEEAQQRIRFLLLQSLNDEFEDEIEAEFQRLLVTPNEARRPRQEESQLYLR